MGVRIQRYCTTRGLVWLVIALLSCLSVASHAETIPAIPKVVGTVQVEATIRYTAWWDLENSFDNFDAYCDTRRLASQPLGSCSNRLYTPLPVYSNQPAGDCIYEQVWWGTRSCTWLTTGNIHYVCPEGYTHWATDHTRCINTKIEYTCPSDQGWVLSGDKCIREYRIKLNQLGNSPIAPTSLLPFYVTVTDQNGAAQVNKQVTIRVDVNDGTGGHIHTADRPKGILSCASRMGGELFKCSLETDYMGQALFDFIATPISGTHIITATCAGCSNTETKSVDVKVNDLVPIPASTNYALTDTAGNVIGAIPHKHTKNHFLTSTSISKLNKLVDVYEGVNPDATLYLNDASLEWGGLFDVGGTPWGVPHSTHDRGSSLDIRAANSGPNSEGAVPAAFFEDFLDKAHKKGLRLGLHCKNSSDTNHCLGQPNNRHFHVDF